MHDCHRDGIFCITVNGKMVIEDTRYATRGYAIDDIEVDYCPFCGESARRWSLPITDKELALVKRKLCKDDS